MIRLCKEQSESNIRRFYLIQVVPGLFANWGVLREWGRIGQTGTVRMDWYASEAEATEAAKKLARVKQKRGYTTIGGSSLQEAR